MLISYGLFALFAVPFWILPEGIKHPLYSIVIGVGMWTPAVASIILAKFVEKTSWRTRVGLRFRGKWKRILIWTPLAALIVLAVHVITALVMVLRGVPGDLTGRTWLRLTVQQLSEQAGMPASPLQAIIFMAMIMIAGFLVTSVMTLGEEIGWRGWLWPALKPLGTLRGAFVGGIIWSLWHLPIVLIGHNYAGQPRYLAVLMFLLPCIAMTLLFGAITDRAAGNPIPAAAAHGAMNSWFGVVLGFISTTDTPGSVNLFIDTPLGLIGVVILFVAGILVAGPRNLFAAKPAAAPVVRPESS
ncbi:CPBP family glutamic-type intramembrane protease [Enemella sp. A6]|uniref:CPBP family glutamic-type intramembrane protease n=1 Tax=Enemella sp. A6 TaxID=3440152 RepID=UPI003EBB488B